ncbi:MAG TPA: sugar ABC transporter permease [Clostridiales bacterium]|nr:sugar ABC transporter permease [Clostridiales bacterium]
MKNQKSKAVNSKLPTGQRMVRFFRLVWKQKDLLVLALPATILIALFKYYPMYGILIALKDYKTKMGIWGSPWEVPLFNNFIRFFNYVDAGNLIWNTVKIGLVTMLFTFPAPIIFALLLNELRGKIFKSAVQTVSYIPYFISVVVIAGMLNSFGSTDGLFNVIRQFFGLSAVNMNAGDKYFLLMYVGSAVWHGVGWGSIIYLAALSNVDTTLYDVANIDGANRWQKVKNIAWPTIMPTTTILLIMNVGNVLQSDYTKVLLMQNDTNRSLIDVIGTYVYRIGVERGEFEYATAVNLFVSIASLILVYSANTVTRKLNPENSLW